MGGQQRHKDIRKRVKLFNIYFGFKEPHKIIIDGNFLNIATKINMNVYQKFQKMVQARIKLATTKCI